MKIMTLALLAGGISSERDVSLSSGQQVYKALDKEKYDIRRYDPKSDLNRLVADAEKIDAALIILHGPYGEDGTVQGLLDLLGIPYQGSGVIGSAIAMNKIASKQLYEKVGLPTPAHIVVRHEDTGGTAGQTDEWVERIGLPLVVKPVSNGSSVGITIVDSRAGMQSALDKALALDEEILVEQFVEGIELTCGVMGNRTLEAFPVIEIVPDKKHAFFNYEAKYTPGETQEICPARIPDALTQKVQAYAKQAHQALFCKGYSRTDMILKEEELFVLETNTIPGMTANSLLPLAARAAGISFGALLDRLIELGIEDRQSVG